jgi:hypothetical protein
MSRRAAAAVSALLLLAASHFIWIWIVQLVVVPIVICFLIVNEAIRGNPVPADDPSRELPT